MPFPKLPGTTPTSAKSPYIWHPGTILVVVTGPDFAQEYEIKTDDPAHAIQHVRQHLQVVRAPYPGEYRLKCRKLTEIMMIKRRRRWG